MFENILLNGFNLSPAQIQLLLENQELAINSMSVDRFFAVIYNIILYYIPPVFKLKPCTSNVTRSKDKRTSTINALNDQRINKPKFKLTINGQGLAND